MANPNQQNWVYNFYSTTNTTAQTSTSAPSNPASTATAGAPNNPPPNQQSNPQAAPTAGSAPAPIDDDAPLTYQPPKPDLPGYEPTQGHRGWRCCQCRWSVPYELPGTTGVMGKCQAHHCMHQKCGACVEGVVGW